jgi:hypothetical protein
VFGNIAPIGYGVRGLLAILNGESEGPRCLEESLALARPEWMRFLKEVLETLQWDGQEARRLIERAKLATFDELLSESARVN